jgi:membrane protease YdiL (CAAX protease family)
MKNENKIANSISDRRRIIEIIGVTITGIGKFIFMDALNWRLPYILTAIVGWTSYTIYRNIKTKGILKYWGFRTDNLKEVTVKLLPFGILSVVTFFVVGYFQHTINLTWHIIPILLLYPLWGIIQQFLMIGLVAGNLSDLKSITINKYLIILITAVLFSLVHYPNIWLVIGTFILALLYGFIYLKSRNVYVLGIFHGWLGGLFYYTIVNRDPFLEVFGKYFQK